MDRMIGRCPGSPLKAGGSNADIDWLNNNAISFHDLEVARWILIYSTFDIWPFDN